MAMPNADRTATLIETRSIDYVPDDERHGKVAHQGGPFWFVGNFQPFTLALGFVGPSLGLSLWWTVVAGIAGIAFGTLFMAFHATQGRARAAPPDDPVAGAVRLPRGAGAADRHIVHLRRVQRRRCRHPQIRLQEIFGWNSAVVAVVITVVAAGLAIFGHDLLHRAFRVLFWISLPLWLVLTYGVLSGGGVPGTDSVTGSFTWVAFLAQFGGVAASYNITYAPYVSDYSRYLPRGGTRPAAIIASVFVGATASPPVWLIRWALDGHLLGRLRCAGRDQHHRQRHGTDAGQRAGGGRDTRTGGDHGPQRLQRDADGGHRAGFGAFGTPHAEVASDHHRGARACLAGDELLLSNATAALNTTLLIMLYLLVPWTAVNLTDFFFVRRGHYVIADLFTPAGGVYGAWSWRGLVAFAAGIAAEIPFVVLPFYTGPVAAAMGDVDIAFIVGLAVSGLVYIALTRSLNLSHELALIAEDPSLADPADAVAIANTVETEEK